MGAGSRLSLGVTKLVGFRRMRIERRLRSLLFRSNRDRVVQLLWICVSNMDGLSKIGVDIELSLSHQDMASIVGTTRAKARLWFS